MIKITYLYPFGFFKFKIWFIYQCFVENKVYWFEFIFINDWCANRSFAEGFKKSGYKSYLAADFDYWSCQTFKNRFKKTDVINEDITTTKFKKILRSKINGTPIEGVVAGLPCQSFSSVGRAQDKFSMTKDKRNYFYKDFFECESFGKPGKPSSSKRISFEFE